MNLPDSIPILTFLLSVATIITVVAGRVVKPTKRLTTTTNRKKY